MLTKRGVRIITSLPKGGGTIVPEGLPSPKFVNSITLINKFYPLTKREGERHKAYMEGHSLRIAQRSLCITVREGNRNPSHLPISPTHLTCTVFRKQAHKAHSLPVRFAPQRERELSFTPHPSRFTFLPISSPFIAISVLSSFSNV